jgi:hypothetical protein
MSNLVPHNEVRMRGSMHRKQQGLDSILNIHSGLYPLNTDVSVGRINTVMSRRREYKQKLCYSTSSRQVTDKIKVTN